MTRVLKSFLSLFLLAAFAISASAQCVSNEAASGGTTTQNYYGQSFVATGCDAILSTYEFYRSGNFAVSGTVEVFAGQTVTATPLYSASVTIPAVASGFEWVSMDLSAGAVMLTEGSTYSVRFLPTSGTIAYQNIFGGYAPGAMLYSTTGFGPTGSYDSAFRVNSAPANSGGGPVADCNISQTTFVNSNSMPTVSDFAQSFSGPCSDAGVFTHLQINRKQNVSGLPARTGTLYLYNGESVNPADQIYSQPVTITAPTATDPQYYNVEIPLGGGTGDLTYTPGNVYTYRIVTSGLLIPTTYNVGSSHPGGSAHWDGVFKSGSDFYFDITIEAATAAVPTMGEWALIILALIIMSMGVVTVMRWESVRGLQTAGGGNAQMSMNTGNSLPFNKKSYFQILPFVWGGLVAVFAVSMAFFGYELTSADVPGALMAGAVGAYLIHLIRR